MDITGILMWATHKPQEISKLPIVLVAGKLLQLFHAVTFHQGVPDLFKNCVLLLLVLSVPGWEVILVIFTVTS